MPKIKRAVVVGAVALLLCAPLPVLAQFDEVGFFPGFGGKITSILPCSLGWYVTIQPSSLSPVSFIWSTPPTTLTFLHGPPRVGVNVVGSYYPTPSVCFFPSKPPIPLFGYLVFLVGTSLTPGSPESVLDFLGS